MEHGRSPENLRSDFYIGSLEGHAKTRGEIRKIPVIRFFRIGKIKTARIFSGFVPSVEKMRIVQSVDLAPAKRIP